MPEFIIIAGVWTIAILFTWPALMGFFVLALFFEAFDKYVFSVLFTVLTMFIVWNFVLPGMFAWYYVAAYFPIGFIWSFYRWGRYCEDKVDANNELPEGDGYGTRLNVDKMRDELNFKRHVDRIICWVLAWPTSALENLVGDLVRFIKRIITTACRKIYTNLTERALRHVITSDANTQTDGKTGC